MNTLQSLTSMIFTWTTLIELILILSPCLIYPYWLAFLILLCYLSFLVRKTYQYLQLIKLSNQMAISNEDIPKEMKAAFYSSSWKRIVDFGKCMVPPKLKGDELLIKVHSAALNPIDFKFITTRLPFHRWIHFPNLGVGNDFSGEVVKVGELVKKYKSGDKVFGFASIGTLQEYTITKEKWIHIIPEGINFQQAASLPMAGIESYQALTYFSNGENTNLSGKNILVIGATGGCGYMAIQIAKFLKADKVYGVCSKEKVDIIKNLNVCEDVLAYNAVDFVYTLDRVLLSEAGKPKLDLILDTVSSPEAGDVGSQYMKYLKSEGKYVSLNSKSLLTFFKGLLVFWNSKFNFEKKGTHCHMLNRADEKAFDVLYDMVSQGKIDFIINNIEFDYQAVDKAFKMLISRKTTGKIVCNIINDENRVN